jgi:hypothetical protein
MYRESEVRQLKDIKDGFINKNLSMKNSSGRCKFFKYVLRI